jgi:hypothetical protein
MGSMMRIGLNSEDVLDPFGQHGIIKSIIDDFTSVNLRPVRSDARA